VGHVGGPDSPGRGRLGPKGNRRLALVAVFCLLLAGCSDDTPAQAGDCGDYKGRVVGMPLSGTGDPVFYSPPTQRGGGIWNPNGPTVDAAGNILVVSANGAAFPGHAYDHTNSVLELDGDPSWSTRSPPTTGPRTTGTTSASAPRAWR
jgi:hypothetical protein